VNRHLWFQADYGIFYAGRFLRETLPGRNLNYWALWVGISSKYRQADVMQVFNKYIGGVLALMERWGWTLA
jgi:hypothetical protein